MKNAIFAALILTITAAAGAASANVRPFDMTGLTQAQRAVIFNILNSDDNDNTKTRRIRAILRRS